MYPLQCFKQLHTTELTLNIYLRKWCSTSYILWKRTVVCCFFQDLWIWREKNMYFRNAYDTKLYFGKHSMKYGSSNCRKRWNLNYILVWEKKEQICFYYFFKSVSRSWGRDFNSKLKNIYTNLYLIKLRTQQRNFNM